MNAYLKKAYVLFVALLVTVPQAALSAQTEIVSVTSVDMRDGILEDEVKITVDNEPCTEPLKFVLSGTLEGLMLTTLMTAQATDQKVQITYDDSDPLECIIKAVVVE